MQPPRQQRHAPRRTPVSILTAVLLAMLGACSGGGGGGDALPPTLLSAAFAGATGTPQAGDLLVLFFSEDMRSSSGAAVTDADLAFSGGASIGAGAAVTAQPGAREVRITLGAGATFTPGTTTVDVAAGNDVFADLAGNLATSSGAVLVNSSDGVAPTILSLTLSQIDGELNGTGPAGGTLQVPQNRWTIDATWADTGLGVDPARAQITASVPLNTAAGSQPSGTNLLPFLTAVTANGNAGSFLVPATAAFPAGPVTVSVVAVDRSGLASAAASFSFTVRAFNDALQPFETTVNSRQVWWLDTTRDIEAFSTRAIAGGAQIDVIATSNGRADLLDLLFVLGLQSNFPLPDVIGADDSNTVVLDRFGAAIIQNLDGFFAGANIEFTFAQPSGSFGSSGSIPYANLGYSQICLAGSSDTAGVLGIAQLDPNNQFQNNDCLLESGAQSRLGVFLHTIADAGLAPPSTSSFRAAFNEIAPAIGGRPIAEVTNDAQRLQGTLTDTRAIRIDAAIADLARFAAVVLAHECGHSMGLVINGPMPGGLYGNDPVNFPGSSSGHIRTQSLFTSGGTNVMSPQLAYSLAINPNTAFNSLNLAYLREQAFYGN